MLLLVLDLVHQRDHRGLAQQGMCGHHSMSRGQGKGHGVKTADAKEFVFFAVFYAAL